MDSTTVPRALTPTGRVGHLNQRSVEHRRGAQAVQGLCATGQVTKDKMQQHRQVWGWGHISGGSFAHMFPLGSLIL